MALYNSEKKALKDLGFILLYYTRLLAHLRKKHYALENSNWLNLSPSSELK